MTTTALAAKLDQLGVSLEQANQLAGTFLPHDTSTLVYICTQVGITGPMLGEILGFMPGDTSQAALDALRDFVLEFVAAGELQAAVDLGEFIGLSAAQIGAAFGASAADVVAVLEASHIDWTELAGSVPEVASVSSTTIAEGETSVQTVTLGGTTIGTTSYAAMVTGELSDVSGYGLSNGVQFALDQSGPVFIVPAGVASFTITLNTAENTVDETGDSDVRTISINVGGEVGVATINDDDITHTPPTGQALMPSDIADWAAYLQLNANTGFLSTAALRADVIAHSNSTDYWTLFDASGYIGAGDGTFTDAEAGWSIGNQPATAETIESVFYGTVIAALRNVDFSEEYDIATFAYLNQAALHNGDEEKFAQLIDMLTDAFGDTAGDQRAFDDDTIREEIVDAMVTLVGYAQYSPSLFHTLLSWTEA
ncbi:MAG: hypothetical protein HY854_19170 [Burkholderiales bacterium]|nr:hypothetical protein [Burkholderiales bacterium]